MSLTMSLLLLLSLYSEKDRTAVCSAIHTKFQNVETFRAKPADTNGTVALGFSMMMSVCTAAEPHKADRSQPTLNPFMAFLIPPQLLPTGQTQA